MKPAGRALLIVLTFTIVLALADAGVASASAKRSCSKSRPHKTEVFKHNRYIVVWDRDDGDTVEYWACAYRVGKRFWIGGDDTHEEGWDTTSVGRLGKLSIVVTSTHVFDCELTASKEKINLRTGHSKRLGTSKGNGC